MSEEDVELLLSRLSNACRSIVIDAKEADRGHALSSDHGLAREELGAVERSVHTWAKTEYKLYQHPRPDN